MWYKILKQLRRQLGLTQQEFAEKLSLKLRTYQAYEQGRSEPSIKTLLAISSITGKSLDWILLGEGSDKKREGSCHSNALLKYLDALNIKSREDMEGFFSILKGYLGIGAYKALIELLEQRRKL